MNTNDQTVIYAYPLVFWLVLLLLIALLGCAFMDALQRMEYFWDTQEEYGYGYIIPLITLFLIWQRKNLLAEVPFRFSYAGLFVMVIAAIVHLLGIVATTVTLSQYAFVLMIMGVALALLGWQAFRIIAVPLAVLFFMVPLPGFLYGTLSTKLQLISSQLGVAVIRLFDISVYLEGNVIDLGTYKLQVVEACSGLRYLFPLMSLSFVAVLFYQAAMWKRIFVFLSSIPITVLMNSFRIGVIGILVENWGAEQAEGFLHYFEGWIIFMACIGILVLEMTVLAKLGPDRRTLAEAFGIDLPGPLEGERVTRVVGMRYWLTAGVLVLVTSLTLAVQGREIVIPDRRVFAEFPLQLGEWKGQLGGLEDNIKDSLRAEDYLFSDYYKTDDGLINLYSAYYDDQSRGDVIHSPRACIPGGGWEIKAIKPYAIESIIIDGKPLLVNRLQIRRGEHTQVVYYWFQQRGRSIQSEWMVKLYMFWDSLTRNRTDGSLIRLTAIVMPGEDEDAADKRLEEFIVLIFPLLQDYIPN